MLLSLQAALIGGNTNEAACGWHHVFLPISLLWQTDPLYFNFQGSANPPLAPAGRQVPLNPFGVSGLTGAGGAAGGACLQRLVGDQRVLKSLWG